MPSRSTAMLSAIGALATIVALVPVVRAESVAADAPCSVPAYVTRLTSVPRPAFPTPTPAPAPSVQGTGSERTLIVTGAGSAKRAADTAYLEVRIAASAADAASAACANERTYTALRTNLGPLRLDDIATFPGATTSVSRGTPPPGGAAQPSGWVSSRALRIVATPGTQLRDAVAAVGAVHGTATSVQFGLTERAATYELALASAMRDAAAQASAAARSANVRLGPLVRVDIAPIEPYSTAAPFPLTAAFATGVPSPDPVEVRASVTATFAVASAANAARPVAALLVVHPYGLASRQPELANLSIDFSDRDNDRTAMLYRHETAYDALWAKLRALGLDPSQVPNSVPQAIPNRTPAPLPPGASPAYPQPPLPSAAPTPFYAYILYRQVRVNALPIAKVQAVVGAFAEAGAKTAEVTFSVGDRTSMVAAANADMRRNGVAQAKAVASAAGLRLVEPPYVQTMGYPSSEAMIWRTPIGSPEHPRSFEPPARIDGWLQANIIYAAAR